MAHRTASTLASTGDLNPIVTREPPDHLLSMDVEHDGVFQWNVMAR